MELARVQSVLFNRHAFRTFMELRGARQQDVANGTKLSAPYVSQLANGDRQDPSIDALRKIAEVLEVQPEALFVPTATARFWIEKHSDEVLEWLGADVVEAWLRASRAVPA